MSDIDLTQASLLGTMILFPDRIGEVEDSVCEEWFTGDYRKAYRYLTNNEGSDPACLATHVGIPSTTVAEWMGQDFHPSYLKQHAENLEREASLRKLSFLGNQLLKITDVNEAVSLIDRFTNSLGKNSADPVTMERGLKTLYKEVERRFTAGGDIMGMSYGIPDLDAVTEGMHKGDLVVVAGVPSMGKTALAMGSVEFAASRGSQALILSFEMTVTQLLMRSLSAESGVPLGFIRSAKLDERHFSRMAEATERMQNWPIHVHDAVGMGLVDIERMIRGRKKKGLDLVVIDYLQIMEYDKSKELQELDRITTGLKRIAKKWDICVMLLSQLNRKSEVEKRKPSMSDLRGSGMIEANADVILFPYREAANCQQCMDKVETADHSYKIHQSKSEIIIGKQRQGERNISVKTIWVGSKTRFFGMAMECKNG